MSPLKSFRCSICGASSPRPYLAEGQFQKRMVWLRRHRKRMHPKAFRKSVKKAVKARKER